MNDADRAANEIPETLPVLSDGLELGYVRVWRKLRESAVFQDPHLLQLWIWILLRAAWESRTVMVRTGRGNTPVTLNRGEFIFGRHAAAIALRCPASTIADRLRTLKNLKMVSIHPGTHYSVVTVLNWGIYQGANNSSRHPTRQASRNPSDRQPSPKRHKEEVEELEERNTNQNLATAREKKPPAPPHPETEGAYFSRVDDFFTAMENGNLDDWSKAYPAIPLEVELQRARVWLKANPAKRKKNLQRFLVNWLAHAQEKGGVVYGRGTQGRDGENRTTGIREKYAGR